MSQGLRIVMLFAGVLTAVWLAYRIRKSKLRTEDAIYWICMAVFMLLVGIWPQIIYKLSKFLGIQSPINCLFLLIIALLIEKLFTVSIQLSQLQEKFEELVAEVALRTMKDKEDKSDISDNTDAQK